MKTDILRASYAARTSPMGQMIRRLGTRRLERWVRVAKRSGLFNDPNMMIVLRATLQERQPWLT